MLQLCRLLGQYLEIKKNNAIFFHKTSNNKNNNFTGVLKVFGHCVRPLLEIFGIPK